MNLKEIAEFNGVKPTGDTHTVSEIVQESYRLAFRAKKLGNTDFLALTESHIENLKSDSSNTAKLSEDLDLLEGLESLGEDAVFDEMTIHKKVPHSHVKDLDRSKAMKKAWKTNKASMTKALAKYRKSSKGKAFYKALGKFNSKMKDSKDLTIEESISLFKAGNSALTHMAVELEQDSSFQSAFNESAPVLAANLASLLESIVSGKSPDSDLVESFKDFGDILCESDDPDDSEGEDDVSDEDDKKKKKDDDEESDDSGDEQDESKKPKKLKK